MNNVELVTLFKKVSFDKTDLFGKIFRLVLEYAAIADNKFLMIGIFVQNLLQLSFRIKAVAIGIGMVRFEFAGVIPITKCLRRDT